MKTTMRRAARRHLIRRTLLAAGALTAIGAATILPTTAADAADDQGYGYIVSIGGGGSSERALYGAVSDTAPDSGWTVKLAMAIQPEGGDALDCSTIETLVTDRRATRSYPVPPLTVDCTARRLVVSTGHASLPDATHLEVSVRGARFTASPANPVTRSFHGYVTTWHAGSAVLRDIRASFVFDGR